MANQIDGIFFDLGDTLLDFGQVDIRGLFEAGASLAYDYLRGLGKPLPSFAAYHRRQLWSIRWNFFKSRITGREFNSLELLGQLSKKMGHNLTPEQTIELAWLWYEPLSRCATVEAGVPELLKRLAERGLVLGIISNTFIPAQVLDRHLEKVGLLELLPIRVYSCDVARRKPHEKIFTTAIQKAHVDAHRIMFVGDSPHADIRGANKTGFISVLKDPTGRFAGSKIVPRHTIKHIVELEDILRQYNG